MEAVAKKLEEVGAVSVHLIALENFKRKPTLIKGKPSFTNGGLWEQGDDAADALAKGWTPRYHLSS